jgi:GAF domain-containing protein
VNRFNPRTWSINTKVFIALLIASLVPLIGIILSTTASVRGVFFDIQANYLTDEGVQRQQAIQTTFRIAISELDLFYSNQENRAVIVRALSMLEAEGKSPNARGAESAAIRIMRSGLLGGNSYFDGVYLMGRTGTSVAITADIGREAPTQLDDMSNTQIFRAGRDLLDAMGGRRELVISQRNGGQTYIELISTVNTTEGDPVGYMVVAFNLDTLIYNNLISDSVSPDTYSFLILPTNDAYLATPEAEATNLISFNSIGAQRAIRREAGSAEIYLTGDELDERVEVLGYSIPVQLLDRRFSLVLEMPTSVFINTVIGVASVTLGTALISITVLVSLLTVLLGNHFEIPLRDVIRSLIQISRNDFSVTVEEHQNRGDSIGKLAESTETTRQRLLSLTSSMEQRLAERSRDLNVTQEIGRAIVGERDLQRMMDNVVNLIADNFETIYHAQIFLRDDNNFAVLRASTGEAGQALLSRGHKLEVGSVSVIGQVVEQSQTIIARDTAFSDVHRRNEFLQETRAELAIPLVIDNQVVGALDVQSKESDAFTPDQVAILETLTNDVTIALENIRLFEESSRRMRQVEIERRNRARLDWDTYLRPESGDVYESRAGNITSNDLDDIRRAVYQHNKPIIGEVTANNSIPFGVPIRLRNQILGVATYELTRDEFRYDKVLLAEELVNRLAISLDNARLFRESQLSAERERIVNEISAKLQGETNINNIFDTAIQEVSRALRTPNVGIELRIQNHEDAYNAQNGNGTSNGKHPEHPSVLDEDVD